MGVKVVLRCCNASVGLFLARKWAASIATSCKMNGETILFTAETQNCCRYCVPRKIIEEYVILKLQQVHFSKPLDFFIFLAK